jgi:thiamine pyrophosphokinase
MRAVIFCGGDINDYEYIRGFLSDKDKIICADSGYRHTKRLGITPDIILGDMDSISDMPDGIETVLYPVRKDFTDGEIAVRYAIEHGFNSVLMLGCMGTRSDHTLTNIFIMRQLLCAGIDAVMVDENNEIRMTDKTIELDGAAGDIVSVVPITERVHIRRTEGVSYAANDIDLMFGTSLGNSNYMTDTRCRIEIDSGLCLIIKSHD